MTRWQRLAPWLGVAFVVLFLVTIAVGGTLPAASASGAKVVSWYSAHRSSELLSNYLMPLVLLLGMLFYGHLRDRIVQGSSGLAATAFGGAVLFAAGGALSAGVQVALADRPASLTPASAHALNLVENYVANTAVGAGVSVLLVAAGLAILGSRQLPAWTGFLGVVLGIVGLAPLRGLGPLPAAIWTLIVSFVLIRRAPAAAAADWAGAPVTKAAG